MTMHVGYNKSLAYFLLNSEISEKLNENVKKFIGGYFGKREKSLRSRNPFNQTVDCLTAMKNNIELFPQSTLFDIYLPEE